MIPKIIDLIKTYQSSIFLGILIILVSFISFNLGKISANTKGELKFTENANIYSATSGNVSPSISSEPSSPKPTPKPLDQRVVASINSDKYHYTWCPGVKQIKEGNKIWFNTAAEAEKSGYKLAGNCSK